MAINKNLQSAAKKPQQQQQQKNQPFQVIEGQQQSNQYADFQVEQQQRFNELADNYSQLVEQFARQQRDFARQQQAFLDQQYNFARSNQQRNENQEDEISEAVAQNRVNAQILGNVMFALFEIIALRKNANPEQSSTAHLHQAGSVALARRLMSDASNAAFTLLNSEESQYAVDDATNLIYDLFVLLEAKGYSVNDISRMLEQKIEESEGDISQLVDGNFQDNQKYYNRALSNQEQDSEEEDQDEQDRRPNQSSQKPSPRSAKPKNQAYYNRANQEEDQEDEEQEDARFNQSSQNRNPRSAKPKAKVAKPKAKAAPKKPQSKAKNKR